MPRILLSCWVNGKNIASVAGVYQVLKDHMSNFSRSFEAPITAIDKGSKILFKLLIYFSTNHTRVTFIRLTNNLAMFHIRLIGFMTALTMSG